MAQEAFKNTTIGKSLWRGAQAGLIALAFALALALPFGAYATSETEDNGADAQTAASSDDSGSLAATDGLVATDNATVFANERVIATTADNARGLVAMLGGSIVANQLDVQTQGSQSAAVATGEGGGSISVANSALATAGEGSPLLLSTGYVEADNVTGKAAGAQLAVLEGLGTVMLANSSLTSLVSDAVVTSADTEGAGADTEGAEASVHADAADADNPGSSDSSDSSDSDTASTASSSSAAINPAAAVAGAAEAITDAAATVPGIGSPLSDAEASAATSAIAIYRPTTVNAGAQAENPALFQASGCTLKSNIKSGALFYLTNTAANVVLFANDLDFQEDAVKLLVAAGNDETGWGTAGKNGATVTFTALDQDLKGDILVDSISSLDLYLLQGSKWTGTSDIAANSAGTALKNSITVNVDSQSGWTLTENATVSNLNIEKGGALLDEDGKAVMIVDKDGNKLVDGASDIKVKVTGEFSTTVKTTDENQLRMAAMDRSAFDAQFGTSTAFGTNGNDAALSDEERALELKEIIVAWFMAL